MVETAKSIARELGTYVAHIVEKKDAENAYKVLEFPESIQSSGAAEVGEMLKTTMQVKREQGCSKAVASVAGLSKGNVSNNTISNTTDLEPTSPTHNTTTLDDIPLSRVYKNLEKALPPSPSNLIS